MFSELRFATRSLVRWRGGAVVAGLTLAIGIGTTTGLYALVRVVLPDLPGVPRLDRLARVYASSQALGVERSQVTLNEFDATLASAKSFSAIGAYSGQDAVLGSGPDVRPVIAGYASPAFFTAMGVPPIEGRVFTASDVTDASRPVILSDALWRKQFPNGHVGSTTIVVDGIERTIVGVMPPAFNYGFVGIVADLWVPLGHASVRMPAIVTVFARLRDGIEWPAARSELAALSRGRGQWAWRAIPIQDDTRYRTMGAYAGTLGPALLILIIASVNAACLLMTRGIARDKELSVRRALGATRLRVIRLLAIENAVLALTSGALGGGLAMVLLRVIAAQIAAYQPSLATRVAADLGLLPITLATSALACLIFGTVPALRLSKRDVAASLNGVPAGHRIQIAGYGARDAIVFAEIAAAAGLIAWTAMMYTLFAELGHIRLAFPADRVVAMRVPAADVLTIAPRVEAVPGVTGATIASGFLGGGTPLHVETGGAFLKLSRLPVGDRFLETIGVPLIRGRSFDAAELNGRADVAIVSESTARRLTPDGNAVGMRLKVSPGPAVTVIGVCRDAVDYGALERLNGATPPDIYVPYEPPVASGEAVVLARLATEPHGALRAIAAAAQMPPGARPARPVVVSDDFRDRAGVRGAMVVMNLLWSFAILTLLLAASGVFSVISQSVAQRTREFGIRLAIGATPREVLWMVIVRETKLIALGIGVGVAFTMGLTRALFVELVRLTAIVPGTWAGALALSGGVAALALTLATYRIIRLEPAAVLRRT